MSERPIQVSAVDITSAAWRLSSHLNLGSNGHHYAYACSAFPELLICKGWDKVKAGRKNYAVMQLQRGDSDFIEIPLNKPGEIARLLTKVRQGQADDLEWERADPTRKALAALEKAARAKVSEGNAA